MVRGAAALMAVLLTGCIGCLTDRNGDGVLTVACLGDSNTNPGGTSVHTWCEAASEIAPRLAGLPTVWKNYGMWGAHWCTVGLWPHAAEQLGLALQDHVDVVVAAFGTNDTYEPLDTVLRCVERVRVNAGDTPLVLALTPPLYDPFADQEPAVEALNAGLLAGIPSRSLIDFWSGVPPRALLRWQALDARGAADAR